MTKKDYIAIARVIEDINSRKATGYRIAEIFADMLYRDNDRFDRDRFLLACGVILDVPCSGCGGKRDVEALKCSRC